jgi:hypothetical protein
VFLPSPKSEALKSKKLLRRKPHLLLVAKRIKLFLDLSFLLIDKTTSEKYQVYQEKICSFIKMLRGWNPEKKANKSEDPSCLGFLHHLKIKS